LQALLLLLSLVFLPMDPMTAFRMAFWMSVGVWVYHEHLKYEG